MNSISRLLSATQKYRNTFAHASYHVESYRKEDGDNPHRGGYVGTSAVITGGREPRVSRIEFYPEIDITSNVVVSCTCPYFRYKVALFLLSVDSTDLEVSKKEFSDSLLKTQRQGICPHLMFLAKVVLRGDPRLSHSSKTRSHANVSARLKELT